MLDKDSRQLVTGVRCLLWVTGCHKAVCQELPNLRDTPPRGGVSLRLAVLPLDKIHTDIASTQYGMIYYTILRLYKNRQIYVNIISPIIWYDIPYHIKIIQKNRQRIAYYSQLYLTASCIDTVTRPSCLPSSVSLYAGGSGSIA